MTQVTLIEEKKPKHIFFAGKDLIIERFRAMTGHVKVSQAITEPKEEKFNSIENQKEIFNFLNDNKFDIKNVRRIARVWSKLNMEYIYCETDKAWYYYNGKCWDICKVTPLVALYKMCDYVAHYIETLHEKGEDQTKQNLISKLEANAQKLTNNIEYSVSKCNKILEAALGLTTNDILHPIRISKMNQDVKLMALRNCVLDLKDFNLHPHNRNFFSTHYLDYDFPLSEEQMKDCPRFKQFISEIFPDKVFLQDFIVRLLGYTLFPGNPEGMFIILYGNGHNGKSVLCNTIQYVLGQYAVTLNSILLSDRCNAKDAAHQKSLLKGKLMGIIGENDKNFPLSEKTLKELASTDKINCERKFYDPEDFENSSIIFAPVNQLPEIRNANTATRRRLVFIPFEREFTMQERDEKLEDDLKLEAEGIFHLMLCSWAEYIQNGIKIPDELEKYKKECISESNPIEQFLEAYAKGTDEDYILFPELYSSFTAFYKEVFEGSTFMMMGKKEFKENLKQRHFKVIDRDKRYHNYKTVYGIKKLDKDFEMFELVSHDCDKLNE